MVGDPAARVGRPDVLVPDSRGAFTLPGAFPPVPPLKSQVPPLEQNALLPGPDTVKVLSVKDEITTSARAAPALTTSVKASVATTDFEPMICTGKPPNY